MALAGVLGLALLPLLGQALGLGEAIVLDQRDMGGTDHRATAALDAVEQVVGARLVQIAGAGVPVELLGQQAGGAGLGAGAAADAGQGRPRVRGLGRAQGQQAVHPLGDRHAQVVAGEAHHGAADQQLPQPRP